MSKKHTAQFHVKRIIESISELANTHHIPCAVTLYRKSTPEIHGSPNLKEAIASQVTNNSQFMSSMKRDLNNNNNNGSFYCLSDKDLQNLLFTGLKSSICLHNFFFSVSTLFRSLCICGIALFLCLSVKLLFITYFSFSLFFIL